MRVFVEGATGVMGLVLGYGVCYGHGAPDRTLEVVGKRQMPVIDGGTGMWSFAELGWTPKYPSWRHGFPAWAEGFKSGQAA
jgi:hypothetical protein